jgi:hypothetical protein
MTSWHLVLLLPVCRALAGSDGSCLRSVKELDQSYRERETITSLFLSLVIPGLRHLSPRSSSMYSRLQYLLMSLSFSLSLFLLTEQDKSDDRHRNTFHLIQFLDLRAVI